MKGNIVIGTGIMVTIIIATLGGAFAWGTKVDAENVDNVQRISKLEEAVSTIKGDVAEIKQDNKDTRKDLQTILTAIKH